MHCSETWINLTSMDTLYFLGFANSRILAKTCPALSLDQVYFHFPG